MRNSTRLGSEAMHNGYVRKGLILGTYRMFRVFEAKRAGPVCRCRV